MQTVDTVQPCRLHSSVPESLAMKGALERDVANLKKHTLFCRSPGIGSWIYHHILQEGEAQMKQTILTKIVPLSVAAVSTLGFAAGAHAMSFKVSGQVDRAFTYANNGKQGDFASVDNNGSNSRFRFTGKEAMENGMTLGFDYEIGLTQYPSTNFDIGKNTNGSVQLDTRHVEAYLEGGFGRLTFGKGDGAAHYADTIDFSGTTFLGGGVEYEDWAKSISFVDSSGNVLGTVGQFSSDFNGNGRVNRLRYDTPSIGGLVLSTSFDNGNAYEVAGRYHASFAGGQKFAAGLSWVDTENQGITRDPGTWQPTSGVVPDQVREQILGGSASVLLTSGLNFTVSAAHAKTLQVVNAGMTNQKGFDATNYFGQVGYIVGRNHFAVNYDRTKDLGYKGTKFDQYGVAYLFDWTKAVQLYASYHLYSVKLPNSISANDAKDINQVFIGTRIKFL